MLSDLEKQDHFIFDFYPFTLDEQSDETPIPPVQRDKEIIAHMRTFSTSIENIKFDE
tara:strand:+ start:426 stop:596 length:171 start_codon:yes stop_codon:yes gene_type:complete